MRKIYIKKEKGVKKDIKQEVKAEPLSASSTLITVPKRPRAVSAEMSLRKRPGAVTRALKALTTPAEEETRRKSSWNPLTSYSSARAPATLATARSSYHRIDTTNQDPRSPSTLPRCDSATRL
jgi:hypothetical protein